MPVILDKLLRIGEGKILRHLESVAKQVNAIEDDFVAMSDEELRGQTTEFRQRLENGESLDELMPEAFATVREASKRTLGQRHYDVQVMGGAALHLGNIAEMKTGEGKTLVATLPTYLNALTGRGVHIVTVNDYLAQRDAEWMGRIHHFLGLEVGAIVSNMQPADRRRIYGLDVTYGTNNEFGFDYLRDNMATSLADCVQRERAYAIIDEVDSILIDEARTPLIISGPSEESVKWYDEFAAMVRRLGRDTDYEVDEKKRTVSVLEPGITRVEDHLGIENLYDSVNTPLISFLNNAIKAKELFKRDKDYVVLNGEVLIVDEHTGRMLHGRRYNEGLHQAIEAKEGVQIREEYQTLASITLQNYFRLYDKLAGMTGTAMTEASEFDKTYKLGVVPIPTNRPMARADQADLVYRTEEAKFGAVVDDIEARHRDGQPVLVGTTSVAKSEHLAEMLVRRGVRHEVLNAKHHESEADVVAMAGRKHAVTVATNMAGRGTDIMLGGNPEFLARKALEAKGLDPLEDSDQYEAAWPAALAEAEQQVAAEHDEVTELGGLYVVGTERHESRRIDNQLRGRSGRQGDPGESRFYLSLEDDLMRLFKSDWVDWVLTTLKVPDDVPIENKRVTGAIANAQAQVESQNFESRKNVLKYDDVMNRQREVVYRERRRVLEGADLKDQVLSMIDEVVKAYVAGTVAEGFAEDWDLDKLWTALKTLYPVSFTAEDLIEQAGGEQADLSPEFLEEEILEDARAAYARREEQLGEDVTRELERRVMLSVLDRKWREHLYEMDYLREGIGLRAYSQRDPLVEYQREGYDMFATMMEGIKEESVGYLFNLEVQIQPPVEGMQPGIQAVTAGTTAASPDGQPGPDGQPEPAEEQPAADEEPAAARPSADAVVGGIAAGQSAGASTQTATQPRIVARGLGAPSQPRRLTYSAPTVDGDSGAQTTAEGGRSSQTGSPQAAASDGGVEFEYAGTPRNAPCPCGSGKKYKRCHGDPANY